MGDPERRGWAWLALLGLVVAIFSLKCGVIDQDFKMPRRMGGAHLTSSNAVLAGLGFGALGALMALWGLKELRESDD